ncbi:importin-5-like isoform X3 [Herrania umbratica]|uniref:Importin-5-like isoform X3 n=1 Tax=Herrania umbratica TaxID=108875 RepID=A0A6J1A560_9ROSI|nr:importin-5-like isoform X3 [Herrania umbratica]
MEARTASISNSFAAHFQELDHILADLSKFEQLISQISSNKDKFRFLFTLLKESRVDSLCLGLCKLIYYEPYTYLQVTSCFNEIFNSPCFFFTSESTIKKMKDTLLVFFESHVSDPFQNHVSNSSAIIFKTVSEFYTTGQWPELLNIMFQYMKRVECRQENVLMLFKNIAEKGNSGRIISHLPTFRSIFSEHMGRHMNLNINSDTNLRITAMSASISLIEFVLTEDTVKDFQCLLRLMMKILTDGVNFGLDSMAEDCLELLIKLARINPNFFEGQLGKVLQLMLKISIEDRGDISHSAIEFLMSLAEKAPDMIRKETQFVKRLFEELIYWLSHIKDDDGRLWEYTNSLFGKDCLRRLCILLDDSIFQWILRLLSYLWRSSKWEERHACLIAIPIISKGYLKMKQENFEELVTMVLESCHDSHPQVKFAAINSIKELFVCLDLFLEYRCEDIVVLTLLDFLNDFQNYQLQERAASVVLNFSEDGTLNIIAPWLDRIVTGVFILFQSEWQMVQEGALITLLSVTHALWEHWQRHCPGPYPKKFLNRLEGLVRAHYNDVMPQLQAILVDAINQSKHMLRAKAMEFILLSGLAVREVGQITGILMSLEGFQMELDDLLLGLMLQVWVKLFNRLQQDFLPYLSSFIPFLLQFVQLKPDISTTSSDEERIWIWDLKVGACEMLVDFAHCFNEEFFPWIDQVTTTLVPLLKFYVHKGVRAAAFAAMLSLLRLAGKKGQSQGHNITYLKQLIDDIMPALLEALHKELQVEICVRMLNSLNECIQIAGPFLDKGRVRCIFDVIKQVIRGSSAGIQESAGRANAEGFDAEKGKKVVGHTDFDAEKEKKVLGHTDFDAEKGKQVLGPVGNLLGTLIITFKASFLPFFQELTSYVIPMWSKDKSAEEKLFPILIFDHVVEHCHKAALKYYDTYLPFLLEACNDENPAVRQAAINGVGVCAEFGGSVFKPYIPEAFSRLDAVIRHPSENDIAYEKAVSALRTIRKFHGDSVDADQESFVQSL